MHIGEAVGIALTVSALKDYVVGTIEAIGATKILAERVGFSTEGFPAFGVCRETGAHGSRHLPYHWGNFQNGSAKSPLRAAGQRPMCSSGSVSRRGQPAAMGPEKAFAVLVKVMEEIQNPMERSAVAMDLFGKSGQGMINIVAQGGPELAKLGEEASRLGFALNAVDAAKAVEAEEAMIKLSAAATGFANLLAVELALT